MQALTALGQSRHFGRRPITSGLPRPTDIVGASRQVAKVTAADIRNERGLQQRRPYISESAFAILTSPASIPATCVCNRSSAECASRVPITLPQPAHCNTEITRCSPTGVTSPRSKVCPSHFAQVEIAIVRSPCSQSVGASIIDESKNRKGHS
jgi:hypothetical protein